jgi:hypothetical protein
MRMRGATLAGLLVFAGPAQAQTPPVCFEIVAAQTGVQPAILIDKCSGRTWQLVRQRGAYRWTVLARDEAAPAVSAAAADKSKCFTFEGRRFCE